MFQRVMIPLDGSDVAEQALDLLPSVAGNEAVVILVGVTELPGPVVSNYFASPAMVGPDMIYPVGVALPAEDYDTVIGEVRSEAKTYLDGVAKRLSGLYQVETLVLEGAPVEKLLDASHEVHADVIMMCSRKLTGLTRFFMGSVTHEIVDKSWLPVIVVPNKLEETDEED
ncbi:universal stress protein [Phototrophicus methaneseepsis]|uniref:Universal stress protein n=1 Tax=Phototrophicus methaneseepsis TaxID=2710758 RepID=A0A7S8E8E9_9CHLR|nr:universal stress protein [Phototrophicus methaneseepsis]QPC82178.1 universal stress protein [Phototrophicus methaneseepsis]